MSSLAKSNPVTAAYSRQAGNIGRDLGLKISNLIGTGDYAVSAPVQCNSLFPAADNTLVPHFSGDKNTRIRHREYIGTLYGSGNNFVVTPFQVNPGLLASFPYLAQIADSFEEYVFNGLVYEYKPLITDFTSTSPGSVTLAMEYRADASPYPSKSVMDNSDFAVSAISTRPIMYGVECAYNSGITNSLLVRQGSGSTPVVLTDMGVMCVGVQSSVGTTTALGELWVSYDVTLMRNKPSPLLTAPTVASYSLTPFATPTLTSTPFLGSLLASVYQGLVPVTIDQGTTITFTAPAGLVADVQLVFSGSVANGTFSSVQTGTWTNFTYTGIPNSTAAIVDSRDGITNNATNNPLRSYCNDGLAGATHYNALTNKETATSVLFAHRGMFTSTTQTLVIPAFTYPCGTYLDLSITITPIGFQVN
jgi:hypothetical protein